MTHGISFRIRGEELFIIRGEVPLPRDTLPTVWVENNIDYLKALKIKEEYELSDTMPDASKENWMCPDCGEEHEGQFTACWNCGHNFQPSS